VPPRFDQQPRFSAVESLENPGFLPINLGLSENGSNSLNFGLNPRYGHPALKEEP
jgi:hypothetical protein